MRLREKAVPVEVIEVKERVQGVWWEPRGHRLAVVSGNGPTYFNVTVYSFAEKVVTTVLSLSTVEVATVSWSPRGDVAVFISSGHSKFEFYDVAAKRSYGSVEHPSAGGSSWDPSGRTFATWKSIPLVDAAPRDRVDNGYQLWTMQGARFFDAAKPLLYQFEWRPRLAS